jgi:hypothetical protein
MHFIGKRAGPSPAEGLWTLRADSRFGPPPVALAEGGPQAGEGVHVADEFHPNGWAARPMDTQDGLKRT